MTMLTFRPSFKPVWIASIALAASVLAAPPAAGAQVIPSVPIDDRRPSEAQVWLTGRALNPNGTTFARFQYQEEFNPLTEVVYQSFCVEIQRGAAPNTAYQVFVEGLYLCTIKTGADGRARQYYNGVFLLRAGDTLTINGLSSVLSSVY